MSLPDRRQFLKKSIHTSALAVAGMSSTNLLIGKDNKTNTKRVDATIPRPIQVVIDDVGWWSGRDGSTYQEPYRTGIKRNHVAVDYQAIVALGKALEIRPQAAFILCEWDRKNILKNVPHSTWMEEKWDNSKWMGPWLEEASDIINNNKEHFEITMHGLGHEWWTNGKFTRAEWADRNGVMRPKEDVQLHIETFAVIMKENNLGELPTSFVPTAFNHGFGITPGNEISMAEILRSNGFTYINTPFYNMLHKENVQHKILGVDNGVLTVDRGADIFDWNVIGTKPEGNIEGTTCGMHWPNLLHDDPDRNQEIVEAWVKLLAPYRNKNDTMLAKNSTDFQKQIAHYNSTKINTANGRIDLDFSDTNQLGTVVANDELTLKVSSDRALTFESDQVQIYSVSNKSIDNTILYELHINRSNRKKASVRFSDAK